MMRCDATFFIVVIVFMLTRSAGIKSKTMTTKPDRMKKMVNHPVQRKDFIGQHKQQCSTRCDGLDSQTMCLGFRATIIRLQLFSKNTIPAARIK
jgi:hypothetical protein